MLQQLEFALRESNKILDTRCNAVSYFSAEECLQIMEGLWWKVVYG